MTSTTGRLCHRMTSAPNKSILGSLFLDNGKLGTIRSELGDGDFYVDSHQIIYDQMAAIDRQGEPVDVVTVSDSLRGAGKLDYVGGLTYLGAIVEQVPTAANARHTRASFAERRICGASQRSRTRPRLRTQAMRGADDLQLHARIDALAKFAESGGGSRWKLPPPMTADEWTNARTSPDCVVADYLFADVAASWRRGGVGKTTLLLYEAAHIVLGPAAVREHDPQARPGPDPDRRGFARNAGRAPAPHRRRHAVRRRASSQPYCATSASPTCPASHSS